MPEQPVTWENIQAFFAANTYFSRTAAGQLIGIPGFPMGPTSIYDAKCGLGGLDAAAALARWEEKITPREVVAGVATWAWPTPAEMEMSSVQLFTAELGTSAVSIVIPYITAAAFLQLEPRSHTIRARVLNASLPSLAISFGAGIPIRWLNGLSPAPALHGQVVEYELEVVENKVAYVRAIRVLGDTVPPTWNLLASSRGVGAPITNFSQANYSPFMYQGEVEILFAGRASGTAWTPTTGFSHPVDGDLVNGGTADGVNSGLKAAVRTQREGGDGLVPGTGTSSGQHALIVSAWRGVAPTDWKRATTIGTEVAFPGYENIAPGGFVLYMTYAQTAAGVIVPEGAIPVNASDTGAGNGFNPRLRRVEPDEDGNVAPPNITLGAAAVVHIIAVRMEPV